MKSRSAYTAIEVLVVVSLVLIVIGMLIPMASIRHEPASRAACGNNLRQIAMAMLVYANENQDAWPVRPSNAAGAYVLAPGHDAYTTIGSFEFLAAQVGCELHQKIFSCPRERGYGPSAPADPDVALHPTTALSGWCVAASRKASANPGYVYDWAVPALASSTRIVLCDRARIGQDRQDHVMAVYADGHLNRLKAGKMSPAADATLGLENRDDGTSYVGADDQDDNVFDGVGDGGKPWTVGGGTATRAWVR